MPPPIKRTTPDEVKSLRAQLGLSQQALADQLGVTRNTVARWEMGLHPISPLVSKFLRTLGRR